MSSFSTSTGIAETSGLHNSNRRLALITVTALFFMWGFMTSLNDILIPHLKSVFELNYVQAALVQFCFFGAYFLMAIPGAKFVTWAGYQRGMVFGLLTAAVGTALFYPAAAYLSYNLFLLALFTLASGITILQIAANPYISALGKPETASSRLNLAQAFNSLGTALAPYFGGILILAAPAAMVGVDKLLEASSVKVPYLELTAALVFLAIILSRIKLPELSAVEADPEHSTSLWDTFKIPQVALGSVAIFLYVGAEVSIGSYLVNYMMDQEIAGFSKETAAKYLSIYWLGAMIGRFIGSGILQFVRTGQLLAIYGLIAAILTMSGVLFSGPVAMWAVLAIGLFNSVMFPNIFTLGIDRLEHRTSQGASILIMAIVGGAIIPVITGKVADLMGIHHALWVPAICYLYIIYYGWKGHRRRPPDHAAR